MRIYDIEQELKAAGEIKHRPDDTLRHHTVEKLLASRGLVRKRPTLRLAAVSAAAVMLAAVVLFAVLPAARQTSYFTIDINPSIAVETDAKGIILSATAQNSDADALLASLNINGIPFLDALRCIVEAAEAQGYLKDNGHVLVAHFGTTSQVTQKQIETAVSESAHRHVNVLLLQGCESDYHASGGTRQSAGISLLFRQAQGLGLESTDIGTLMDAVKKNGNAGRSNGTGNSKDTSPAPSPTAKPSNGHGSKPEKTESQSGGDNGSDQNGIGNENNGNNGNDGNDGNDAKSENSENSDSNNGNHSGKDKSDNKNNKG